MQPWPTAYTFWHRAGQPPLRLLVLKATARAADETAPPGTILVQPDLSRLSVVAGGGSIVDILELQPAGKKRMTAAEFVRGRRPQPGDRLGPETA
jgi:methionyl-tRNA formyltransferase